MKEDKESQPLIIRRQPDRPSPTPSETLFASVTSENEESLRSKISEAVAAWLAKSRSKDTRSNYERDLFQFLEFCEISQSKPERIVEIRPHHVASWRDSLTAKGLTNNSVRRKITVLRSLFSYLKTYGFTGANPAHSDFVEAPAAPRDGKTVGLSPQECRRLIDTPDPSTPVGTRDRAILTLLAYSAIRVGELVKLRVGDVKTSNGHKMIEVQGKGGKPRRSGLHPEAVERLEAWLKVVGTEPATAPLFRPPMTSRGKGRDGFRYQFLSKRAVQTLVEKSVAKAGLDPAVTAHSFRVTALTTARERGVDIIDLQDFAGHADPRTTLTYIRNRDRLSKSPAYVLKY